MNQQCALALKKQLMQRNVVMGRKTAKLVEGFEELLFTTKLKLQLTLRYIHQQSKQYWKMQICAGMN